MPIRDLLVAAIIFGSIPFILKRPYVGILVWSWISYMNPHRLTWGFAYDFQWAQLVGVVTLVSILFSREPKTIPVKPLIIVWLAYIAWMIVTTIFAIYPSAAYEHLNKILKIQFFTFVTIMLINTKERLNLLIWVIVASIGFYSVKGGLFTLLTGGVSRVYGPERSFIAENNAMALATLMIIPLMQYLRLQSNNRWVRAGLVTAMLLSAASILGSHSRGAFLAGVAMAGFFWARSSRRLLTGLVLAAVVLPLIAFMPEKWSERIGSISEHSSAEIGDIESMRTRRGDAMLSAPIPARDRLGFWPNDFSALGRVNAWNFAINVANDRPTGGGLESWSVETFAKYAPIVEEVQGAHSVFFSVLADHGWIGLFLFLGVLAIAWRNASRIISVGKARAELKWAADLMRMVQVSLLAYFVGGAFLSLAYFDLPWHLIAVILICFCLAERHLRGVGTTADASSTGPFRKYLGVGSGVPGPRTGGIGK